MTHTHPQHSANNPLVDMAYITAYTGMTDKWFYKLIKDGEFPKPIKLGRRSRWLRSEVEEWMQRRIDRSRPSS
ncbi:AlpA family transcriptional regulator [Candidatus Symbiopectobacterium sp. NZEC151]|uniref:helix-turn-helix transcriptional regulator n=1 Tax=Candidatus Symbiopectobacterium sp. NZEC151 TaxID=2820470 RepID=UPI00222653C5|nr:AlpA family transcriptional regulator [Candidatus Symbiopectobacterium sp. NZEC151]MCW2474465.1 AlpA family transcriptional regulator [Candidatus Symbiopectobacterium sp. NZEC151]